MNKKEYKELKKELEDNNGQDWKERFDELFPRSIRNEFIDDLRKTYDSNTKFVLEPKGNVKDFIRQELARQNKKLNEQCEVIVNRELKSQADRIIKRLDNRFLKEGSNSAKASSYNLALKEAILIIREETSKS